MGEHEHALYNALNLDPLDPNAAFIVLLIKGFLLIWAFLWLMVPIMIFIGVRKLHQINRHLELRVDP